MTGEPTHNTKRHKLLLVLAIVLSSVALIVSITVWSTQRRAEFAQVMEALRAMRLEAVPKSITFDDPWSIGLVLEDATVAERFEAVRELLLTLDSEDDIVSTAAFEEGRVMVITKTGADDFEWSVPFHLVWPEPQLNNQHLNAVKLVNWTATGKAVEPTARAARQEAIYRLRDAIRERIDAGGSLKGRIRVAE